MNFLERLCGTRRGTRAHRRLSNAALKQSNKCVEAMEQERQSRTLPHNCFVLTKWLTHKRSLHSHCCGDGMHITFPTGAGISPMRDRTDPFTWSQMTNGNWMACLPRFPLIVQWFNCLRIWRHPRGVAYPRPRALAFAGGASLRDFSKRARLDFAAKQTSNEAGYRPTAKAAAPKPAPRVL